MGIKILSIDGNIGAGKSTLLDRLKQLFSHRKDIIFVTEPVEEFMTFQGQYEPFRCQELRPYHESVAVQMHITNTLLKHYFKVFTNLTDDNKLMICDRYIHAIPVFIETLRQMGYISDFSHAILLKHAEDILLRVLPQANFVYYLDPPLSVIESRIATRGREGECGFLTRKYLEILHGEYPKHVLAGATIWKRNTCAQSGDIILQDCITFVNNNMSQSPSTTFTPLSGKTRGNCVDIDDDDTTSPPTDLAGTANSAMETTSSIVIEEEPFDNDDDTTGDMSVCSSTTSSQWGPWWSLDMNEDDQQRNIKKKKVEKSSRSLSDLAAETVLKNRLMSSRPGNIASSAISRPQKRIVPTRIYPRTIQYVKLHRDAQPPYRGSEGAAGYDLTTLQDEILLPNQCTYVRTGIALSMPANCYGQILDRSSVVLRHKLITVGGVIDEDYVGEIKICFINLKKKVQHISKGARIAQIVFQKYVKIDTFQEVTRFTKTSQRGAAGFGSTGGSF